MFCADVTSIPEHAVIPEKILQKYEQAETLPYMTEDLLKLLQ